MKSATQRVSQRVLRESHGGGAKVWSEIIKLSQGSNIVSNLGQGFPDFEGAKLARDTAVRLIESDVPANQYSPVPGTARLRKALAASWNTAPAACSVDPDSNIMVTSSGTEAIYAAMQAIVDPGDEVIIFEPFFPWYLPAVRMAGGVPVCVTLQAPGFVIDLQDLAAKFSPKTKAIIFNTPHNPTGHVATMAEMEGLAELCLKHDVLLVSDEVYEHFVFRSATGQQREHHRISSLPGMFERTLTIGSSSKMFSLTGWRVGWCFGPPDLISAIGTCHAYNSYCAPTPLQDGVAAGLEEMVSGGPNSVVAAEIAELSTVFQSNASTLSRALECLGVVCFAPEGGYFLVCDVSATGKTDVDFCRWLATDVGVIAVPMSVFHDSAEAPKSLVRFAICKRAETIKTAAAAIESASPAK